MSLHYSIYYGPTIIIVSNKKISYGLISEITNERLFRARSEFSNDKSYYIVPNIKGYGISLSRDNVYDQPIIIGCCVNNLQKFKKDFEKEIELLRNIFGEDTISIQTMIVQDIY